MHEFPAPRFNPSLGPIAENTLALIDTLAGNRRVLQEWGGDLFYMPHGLTIDGRGRLWLTDVGAHQVSKGFRGRGGGGCCGKEEREEKETGG